MNSESNMAAVAAEPDARDWAKILAPYGKPGNTRGIFEIAVTTLPLIGLWVLAWLLVDAGYWAGLLLTIPAAAFLLRLFLIQHDCGHGAFFSNRTVNDWTGRIIGVFTFTPYYFWKHTHNLHHAGSGNLCRRGFGDISTLTVEEYRAASSWKRLIYRLYRNPIIMFVVGPGYIFLFDQRLPLGQMRKNWRSWGSTMGTNVSIAVVSALLIWLVGFQTFLLIQLPIVLIAASVGVWLFFVQHQFEDSSWDHNDDWNRHEAALHGSSHYDLPQPLRWLTANIGLHHIHHLSSRIPYYRLSRVVKDHPSLKDINRLTLLQSFKCVPLTLWDESSRSMVKFSKAGF